MGRGLLTIQKPRVLLLITIKKRRHLETETQFFVSQTNAEFFEKKWRWNKSDGNDHFDVCVDTLAVPWRVQKVKEEEWLEAEEMNAC